MILPPTQSRPFPDRNTDCQLALEPHLQDLIDQATAAGWERSEVTTAIATLTMGFLIADLENNQTDLHIARTPGTVH
jgi:hypothetical protein